jgi:hypothetical protein
MSFAGARLNLPAGFGPSQVISRRETLLTGAGPPLRADPLLRPCPVNHSGITRPENARATEAAHPKGRDGDGRSGREKILVVRTAERRDSLAGPYALKRRLRRAAGLPLAARLRTSAVISCTRRAHLALCAVQVAIREYSSRSSSVDFSGSPFGIARFSFRGNPSRSRSRRISESSASISRRCRSEPSPMSRTRSNNTSSRSSRSSNAAARIACDCGARGLCARKPIGAG